MFLTIFDCRKCKNPSILLVFGAQVVYILDQVRALENEMILRIQKQGLDVIPKILIVSVLNLFPFFFFVCLAQSLDDTQFICYPLLC